MHTTSATAWWLRSTNIDSIGPGAAEGWSGADFAITATIRDARRSIDKTILVQAKLDDLDDLTSAEHERLIGQVRDMRDLTRSPKVMVAPLVNGIRETFELPGVPIRLMMRMNKNPYDKRKSWQK